MSERRALYEEKIRPLLDEVGKLCVEGGINYVAAVETDQGALELAATFANLEMTSVEMLLVAALFPAALAEGDQPVESNAEMVIAMAMPVADHTQDPLLVAKVAERVYGPTPATQAIIRAAQQVQHGGEVPDAEETERLVSALQAELGESLMRGVLGLRKPNA